MWIKNNWLQTLLWYHDLPFQCDRSFNHTKLSSFLPSHLAVVAAVRLPLRRPLLRRSINPFLFWQFLFLFLFRLITVVNMSFTVAMSFSVAISSTTAMTSTVTAPKKSDFHPAFAVTNIKNNIPFVLEMEKYHYNIWTELFEIHACAHKVLYHIFLNPTKKNRRPMMLILKCGQLLIPQFFNRFIRPFSLIYLPSF